METRNGTTYHQNYDVIVKWLAAALCGETLEVLGIKTGRIEEVFGFEPVELPVTTGRVDILARDDTGALYHLEEQRDLSTLDLYRFAAYHFLLAKQWRTNLTDIILASGEISATTKAITTQSGTYTPVIVDFTQRNGPARLAEIRTAVAQGTFKNWFELVLLPLYGKETGTVRSRFVEQVLRFESELCRAEKVPARLLAATLILSNKLVDRTILYDIWEEIKMLDILEVAEEKGFEKGEVIGIQKGKALGLQEGLQTMIVDTLVEHVELVPTQLSERIRAITNVDVLKGLYRQAIKCTDLNDFEAVLAKVA